MPDDPKTPAPNPLDQLMEASVALVHQKLAERPLSPHVFDEISIMCSSIHKACTALDPVINLPKPRPGTGPLAGAPASEGAGFSMARQLMESVQEITKPRAAPISRKDLIAAIALAKREGLDEDVARLRAELYDEDDEDTDDGLSPRAKVDRANRLIEEGNAQLGRAKALLESVKPTEIIETEAREFAKTAPRPE